MLTQEIKRSQHANGVEIGNGAEGFFNGFAGHEAPCGTPRKAEAHHQTTRPVGLRQVT